MFPKPPTKKTRAPWEIVNPQTNPSSGLSFPNGSYIPSTNLGLTTPAVGGLGAFGAQNPKKPVQGPVQPPQAAPFMTQSMLPKPPSASGQNAFLPFNLNQPTAKDIIKPKFEGRGDPAMQAIRNQTNAASIDLDRFQMELENSGQTNFDLLPQTMSMTVANLSGTTPSLMAKMGYKLIDGEWVQQLNAKIASDMSGMGYTESQLEYYAQGGAADFLNTGFMQENIANNVSFNNQLRWDPTTNSYQKIGKLVAQGKLDIKTGKDIKKKKKNNSGGNAPTTRPAYQPASTLSTAPKAETPRPYTTSTTGNFNTAGG